MNSSWFKDFKERALDLSKKTGKNVNIMVEIKKNELEVLKVNREIAKIFKTLGETVYAAKKADREMEGIDTLCKQIDVKKAYVKEIEKRIEYIKENKRLEESGFDADIEVPEFIKNTETNEEIAVLNFCPECNTGNDITAKVCKECGKKLKKAKIK